MTPGNAADASLRRFQLDWRWTLGICAALLMTFGILSYTAILHKSATYDETLHTVGGFMHRFFKDYRINPEDPALFGMWAALPQGDVSLGVDIRQKSYQVAPSNISGQWIFVVDSLYRNPGNDPDEFVNASRGMFTWLGIGLGAMMAWWSWRLAGAVATIVAVTLFAFDPNMAAHASLVKNDVGTGLLLVALAYAIWQFGKRGGFWRLLIVAALCGMGMNLKFSGVLFAPITLILLLCRALMNEPWHLAGMHLLSRGRRALAVAGMMLVITFIIWGTTWAVYGFRFAALSDGGTIDSTMMMNLVREKELVVEIEKREHVARGPTAVELAAKTEVGFIPNVMLGIEQHGLLPQAWTMGFLYTYATTLVRSSFLMGQNRITGFWYYFPMAMLFKTPTATLIAIFTMVFFGVGRIAFPGLAFWRAPGDPLRDPNQKSPLWIASLDIWSALCLAVPPGIYMLIAMTSNLNLGLRHVLPVYPFLFIAVGLTASYLLRWNFKLAKIAGIVLALGLIAESISSYPNYLPFFNTPSGGSRGGMRLLADSNLDWGQDLPALADWCKTHTDKPLLLSYFGMADPAYYGLRFAPLAGGHMFYQPISINSVTQPCYAAISATNLQGVYMGGYKEFEPLQKVKPIAVLNGSIYIFDWPLK